MSPFLALMRKDFQLFFNDRRSVIMSFVAPILIGSFFGYVFGGSTNSTDPGRTTVLIVDQENGRVSKEIASKLMAEKSLDAKSATLEEARALVRKGSAPVAIVIPPDFGKLATQAFFRAAQKPAVTLLTDPSHQAEGAMIEGILTGHVMQAVSKEAFSGQTGKSTALDGLKALEGNTSMANDQKKALRSILEGVSKYDGQTLPGGGEDGGGLSVPFTTTKEQLTAESGTPYNPYAHSFGGMAIQFILFMGIDVGIGLLLQRQRGLWKRFRAAPLSKLQLLGSRAVSAMLIAVIILVVVFAFARVVFGVRIQGSLPGFLAVTAAFGLMTATYGLLIAALGKTAEAARGLSILGTLMMVMLSGAWVPSFLFPGWLQNLTKLVPARWAMDGLDAMSWRGLPASEAVMPVLVLLGFSALFGTIAVLRFRWEEQ
jgi:ABC-2 type transport system permease protein